MPYFDRLQAAFGGHDLTSVRAHVGGAARDATARVGAEAYAMGEQVAFGSQPDLHTAAHEAAHTVQQRAGIDIPGGVGKAGDAYERNADAVADAVVRGESAELLLGSVAGSNAAGSVQAQSVQLIGTPLDRALPTGAPVPAHGEDRGVQRRYTPEQYVAMWEAEQGRTIMPAERTTIDRGCIGVTAMNLNGGGNPPLDMAYGTFDQAHQVMTETNATRDWMGSLPVVGGALASEARYVLFAKLFWSSQDSDAARRRTSDATAFRPDPATGRGDMSGYGYRARPGYVNFDYGFWDEASQSFWHANHGDYGDPADPMIVLQSTKDKFAAGYFDFDRIVYCVALAKNYNPGLAAIASARASGGTP